jgi:DNA repair exonuclease SbcCD nuclease subunit
MLKYKSVLLPTEKINFVYSTDWHFSDRPPGRRRDNYKTAILEKIHFIRSIAQQYEAVGLCGGDVFHLKNPKHPANSLSLVVDILHALRQFPLFTVFGSIGNHDLSFDRMESLSNQPLGLLIATGVYHDLNTEPVLFFNKDRSFSVLVETFPYENNGANTLKRILEAPVRPAEATYRIGIVHQYGAPGNRGDMWGTPIIGYNEVQNCDYDILLWGHDHSRKETVTVGNTTHVNLGSLARAALPTDEDGHPVVATLLSFTKEGAYRPHEIPIPIRPLETVFAAADKGMDNVGNSEEVSDFFQNMDTSIEKMDSVDPREVLKLLCSEDPETLNFTLELCNFS